MEQSTCYNSEEGEGEYVSICREICVKERGEVSWMMLSGTGMVSFGDLKCNCSENLRLV